MENRYIETQVRKEVAMWIRILKKKIGICNFSYIKK